MNENSNCENHKIGLVAYLTPLAVIALSFGYAVGWGAFVMPGTTFLPKAGPIGTTIGILFGALTMSLFAFNYYRMLRYAPGPGGAFSFATKAFGADHGFLVSWFLVLTYVAILWANATALVLLARYIAGDMFQFGFHYTMVGFDVYLGEVLLCILAIAIAGGACMFRKRFAIRFHMLLAGVFLAGVVICFLAALLRHEGGLESMAPAFSEDGGWFLQVVRILAMIPWAFVGFEAIVNSSGEFRFPIKRTFGIMIAGIAISALIYILLAILPVLMVPDGYASWNKYMADLSSQSGINAMPVFAAARKALGTAGIALSGGTMLAAQLTGLTGTFFATSRLMFAMSNDGILPRWFGELDGEGSPRNAMIFVMCASFVIPFFGRTVTGWPVDVSSLCAAIIYGYTSAAAFATAGKGADGPCRAARVTGLCGVALSVVFGLLMLVPNYIAGNSFSAESYLVLSIWCILGFLLYRRVFSIDRLDRFGHSTIVWIGVLVMIFFSSLMWIRLAICNAAENALAKFLGKVMNEGNLSWLMGNVRGDMLRNSLIEMGLLVASLLIMLSLFSILRRREKDMAAEKLKAEESANKSKSYFFSTVSHDIRTPLNAIIGFSQMLKMGFSTKGEQDRAIDSILLSSKTLLCLINDVLDFSKLESGRMTIEPEPTNCEDLLMEIAESFRIANKTSNLEIRYKAARMPVLMVDPQRIRQILFNLVGNAVKFTKAGFVEMRASFDKIAGATDGTLRIEVQDTGCGIGEDDLKRIASPYVQVRSKAARHGGTGLGLAICRQLAVAMGGEMDITSSLGVGSTFSVSIPGVKVSTSSASRFAHTAIMDVVQETVNQIRDEIQASEQEATSAQEQEAAPASAQPAQPSDIIAPNATSTERKRILIADDQKMNLMVLKALLSKLGPFDITMAKNGKEALSILETAEQFDLVLTDMWMPEMDGEGLVRAIRANARISSLPTYVVTADVEMLKQYEQIGFTGILLKPITIEKLSHIICKY